jgi:hypothetical protein
MTPTAGVRFIGATDDLVSPPWPAQGQDLTNKTHAEMEREGTDVGCAAKGSSG